MIAWKTSRASRHRGRTDLPDGPPRFAIKWHEPKPATGPAECHSIPAVPLGIGSSPEQARLALISAASTTSENAAPRSKAFVTASLIAVIPPWASRRGPSQLAARSSTRFHKIRDAI